MTDADASKAILQATPLEAIDHIRDALDAILLRSDIGLTAGDALENALEHVINARLWVIRQRPPTAI